MRYGFARNIEGAPFVSVQRRALLAAGAEIVLEDAEVSRASQRAMGKVLAGLKAGDEVLVHDLDIFQLSTGQLALQLRRFCERGVVLRLVGEAEGEAIALSGGIPRVLSLLADHESRRPTRAPIRRRSRAHRKALSRYQMDYAQALRRRGESWRRIGMLFQMTPDELAHMLREDGPPEG